MPNEAIDPFQFLTEADHDQLFEGKRRASYRRGDFLFREGDTQPNLYVVQRGWVRVERIYRGQGLAVARYGPAEVLGEIAFLEQRPAFGSAIAEEDVEADILDGRRIQSKLASDTGFASRFYQSLAVCLGQRLRQVLPGILQQEGGGGARLRVPRTGQVSERQFPVKLIEDMETFRAGMSSVAVQLGTGKLAALPAGEAVAGLCNAVVDQLNEFTRGGSLLQIGMDDLLAFRDTSDIARGIGAYVFRETFAVFMQSATIALGYEKPRRRAEDREFLERIEGNVAEGDGRIGPLVDRWFLDRPLCRSRRNSLRRITGLLKEAIAGVTARGSSDPLRVTSLAAGTATEIFDLLAGKPPSLLVTCLDSDADTLMIDGKRAGELGHNDSITFLQANLVEVIRGQAAFSPGPQQVIYGLGVCDYLGNDDVRLLMNWAHEQLVPGGWLILTNRDEANPDRAFAEHILDWPVRHRTQAEFSDLFAGSRFGRAPEISVEEAAVNIFARCAKS